MFSSLWSQAPVLKCSRRPLFSFPDFSSSSLRKTYREQRILPYSSKELYAVVADVASYPKFVPFCVASRIDASARARAMQQKTLVDAELTFGFMSFKESYVSNVTCIPYASVQASASSSTPLFKNLSTTWKFQSATSSPRSTSNEGLENRPGPSLVSYDLAYEFANPLHAATSAAFFDQLASMMIKAFEDRCCVVYGKRPMPDSENTLKPPWYQILRKCRRQPPSDVVHAQGYCSILFILLTIVPCLCWHQGNYWSLMHCHDHITAILGALGS